MRLKWRVTGVGHVFISVFFVFMPLPKTACVLFIYVAIVYYLCSLQIRSKENNNGWYKHRKVTSTAEG